MIVTWMAIRCRAKKLSCNPTHRWRWTAAIHINPRCLYERWTGVCGDREKGEELTGQGPCLPAFGTARPRSLGLGVRSIGGGRSRGKSPSTSAREKGNERGPKQSGRGWRLPHTHKSDGGKISVFIFITFFIHSLCIYVTRRNSVVLFVLFFRKNSTCPGRMASSWSNLSFVCASVFVYKTLKPDGLLAVKDILVFCLSFFQHT